MIIQTRMDEGENKNEEQNVSTQKGREEREFNKPNSNQNHVLPSLNDWIKNTENPNHILLPSLSDWIKFIGSWESLKSKKSKPISQNLNP